MMNKINEVKFYVAEEGTPVTECDGCCGSCKKNQCGMCSHYGVNVSSQNNCSNAEKRAQLIY